MGYPDFRLERPLGTMNNQNPDSKKIDINTQEGLELLKIKAKFYGHYADHLKVLELIRQIEDLKESESPRDWNEL